MKEELVGSRCEGQEEEVVAQKDEEEWRKRKTNHGKTCDEEIR